MWCFRHSSSPGNADGWARRSAGVLACLLAVSPSLVARGPLTESDDSSKCILDEILLVLGLEAKDGPGGSILIVPRTAGSGRLTGRVVSAGYGRSIVGASVRLTETGASAVTDVEGRFEIREIPVGTYEMTIEALGFSTTTVARLRVAAGTARPLSVELNARPRFVTEVLVTPGRHALVRQDQSSHHRVTSEDAVLVPTIGGDISRVVELLPGVAARDNSTAFNVRGSVAQDVSFALDGLELYDPFHLQSFQSPFSIVDGDVVDRIDYLAGGFTADLGDRHGGFVEFSTVTPDGSADGAIQLGTLNSRATYTAPTPSGGTSWLLSARAWYPEAFLDSIELGGGESLSPRFGDLRRGRAERTSMLQRNLAHRRAVRAASGPGALTREGGGVGIAGRAIVAESVEGALWVQSSTDSDSTPRFLAVGDRLALESEVATGSDGRFALRLGSGHSVRLDRSTRVRLLGQELLALDRGTVYVDSGFGASVRDGLVVRTPLGVVQEIGTQFEVRLETDDTARIRLREGAVALRHAATAHEIVAGRRSPAHVRDVPSRRGGDLTDHDPSTTWPTTSFTSFAATTAVTPVGSCRGLYSTTSTPMTGTVNPWIMPIRSRTERPPGSGCETPGANAGSNASRSMER